MPRPKRDEVLPPDERCFAHLYNRCVQGTYLCGWDEATGRDYSHRKKWIVDRLEQLASIYLIDILGYAVLDNHLHVVVRTLPDEVEKLSDHDVALRWLSLHPGRELDEFVCIDPTEAQIQELLGNPDKVKKIRGYLSSSSSFMKDLCEPISKRSNREDGRKGHFWEDRFKAERLLDCLAILVCLAYVDLNIMRAGKAITLERSDYSSIQARILGSKNQMAPSLAFAKVSVSNKEVAQRIKDIPQVELRRRIEFARKKAERKLVLKDAWLAKLTIEEDQSVNPVDSHLSKSGLRASDRGVLPLTLEQYIKILYEALRFRPGRAQEPCKELKDVASTLGVLPENISWMISDFRNIFRHGCRVGSPESMRLEALKSGRRWSARSRNAKLFYSDRSIEYDETQNKYFRSMIKSVPDQSKNEVTAG